jgi:uncharacterized membrane protein
MESNKRSLIKTLTWETVHLVGVAGIISVITWILTGNVEYEYATLGALAYIAFESIGYYIHERVWANIPPKVKVK